MNRKKIFLASILKPVNDARMYEKFGISLSKDFEVHIAGYSGNIPSGNPHMHFHPLFSFKRLSIKRILAPWKIYKLCIKVKPDVVVVNSHELLFVMCIYKILFGVKILYDVQENYYLNILHTDVYATFLKPLLAGYVRFVEIISKPFIHHYILAEKCYANELFFVRSKFTIVENKYKAMPLPDAPSYRWESERKIRLLYSGTISTEYGIFEAIEMAKQLYRVDSRILLIIIGYAAKTEIREKLKASIKHLNFVKLITDSKPVQHSLILQEIRLADYGLLSYQPNPSTRNCIPTKLFEYTAHKLPMIIQHNSMWEEYCKKFNSSVFIDYNNFKPLQLLNTLQTYSFYENADTSEVFWENEEKILLSTINNIL
ncbi:MAG: glycosyltransferase [Cytophagaceae bacterium]